MIQDTINRAKVLFLLAEQVDAETLKIEAAIEQADQLAILHKEAMTLLQTAADSMQKDIKNALTSLCTAALQDVFPEKKCSFGVEFVPNKATTNLEMFILEDEVRYDPLESRGHGIADVLCFALRVSILCMKSDARKIILLDEPFKQVSAEYRKRVINFVKEVSRRTGIQIIMVTHIEEFADHADNTITVSYVNGKSVVKAETNE